MRRRRVASVHFIEYSTQYLSLFFQQLEFISVSPKKNERVKLREYDIYVVILRIACEMRSFITWWKVPWAKVKYFAPIKLCRQFYDSVINDNRFSCIRTYDLIALWKKWRVRLKANCKMLFGLRYVRELSKSNINIKKKKRKNRSE